MNIRNTTKICCHCGSETHPQPQDYNHDRGYGHCYKCLNKESWYIKTPTVTKYGISIDIWSHRPFNNGDLPLDDSESKVIEIKKNNKIIKHSTIYARIGTILNKFENLAYQNMF